MKTKDKPLAYRAVHDAIEAVNGGARCAHAWGRLEGAFLLAAELDSALLPMLWIDPECYPDDRMQGLGEAFREYWLQGTSAAGRRRYREALERAGVTR